ncbi:hypothetical protein PRUB_a0091 [Pseudoalteromonas rubra]|uniref:Uncharacterized protein n=1 Tax=Pseudoalteromonas rubra TaxID=43658 RepID=A0A8T0C4U2_9GAMM|nr:hypothetical protein [Pseudoalteromonas rubra]KAF7785724.1 hypothetical protein PRUB_a0091 [Pseudoalteromonas rubra]
MTNQNSGKRDQIKEFFKTGDRPTQQQFAEWIDACLIQESDDIYGKDNCIGIGTKEPTARLSVELKEPQSDVYSFSSYAIWQDKNSGKSESKFGVTHALNDTSPAVCLSANGKTDLMLGHFDEMFASAVTITPNGYVGIGTESPDVLLHVCGQSDNKEGDYKKAKIGFDEGRLSADNLTLKGTSPSILLEETKADNSKGAEFSLVAENELFRLGASRQPERQALQVSAEGFVGIGCAPDRAGQSECKSSQLKVNGHTSIKGDLTVEDGTIKSPNADLSIRSIHLDGNVNMRAKETLYATGTTRYLDLEESAINLKTLSLGDGYTSQEPLEANSWYTIAELSSQPSSRGSAASYLINLDTENPNTRSTLIVTVALNNKEAALNDTVDINVSMNTMNVADPKKLSLSEIRLIKKECNTISLQLKTNNPDSKIIAHGHFAVLSNLAKHPWKPVPWNKFELESLMDDFTLSLDSGLMTSTQGLQVIGKSEEGSNDNRAVELSTQGSGWFRDKVEVAKSKVLLSSQSDGSGRAVLYGKDSKAGIELSAGEKKVTIGDNHLQEDGRSLRLTHVKDDEIALLSINTNPQSAYNQKASLGRQSFQTGDNKYSTFHVAHPSAEMLHLGANYSNNIAIGNFDEKFKSRIYINGSNGCVGIGTDNPSQQLDVAGSAHIKENLGIGVENPVARLHVDGNAEIQGSLKLGQGTLTVKGEQLLLTVGDKTFSVSLTEVKSDQEEAKS